MAEGKREYTILRSAYRSKVVIVNVPWFPLPLEKSAEIDVEIEHEKIILKRMKQI